MADPRVQTKRGLLASLPVSGMLPGEVHYTTDRKTLHLSDTTTTLSPVVPPVELLTTLGTVSGSSDLLLIHDADGSGVKEKKITASALVAAVAVDAIPMLLSGADQAIVTGVKGGVRIRRAGTITSVILDCSPNDEPASTAVTADVKIVNRSTGTRTSVLSSLPSIATGANTGTGTVNGSANTVSAGDYIEFSVVTADTSCKGASVYVEVTPG